jgi:hypothetical protein
MAFVVTWLCNKIELMAFATSNIVFLYQIQEQTVKQLIQF